jgi:hypothetical protein
VSDTTIVAGDSTTPAVTSPRSDTELRVVDEISASTTRADLAARFGAENVTDTTIYLMEGETRPGSVLFAADSSRRVEITWTDSVRKSRPATIHLNGTASAWKIPHNISLGMTLSELERLNGGAFTLMGFGWDYGGTITDWKGGMLSDLRSGTPRVFLRLSLRGSAPSEVTGDREISSEHPVLRRLNPVLEEIILSYETAG